MHVLLKGNKKNSCTLANVPVPGDVKTQITAPRQASSVSSSKASSGSWPLSPLRGTARDGCSGRSRGFPALWHQAAISSVGSERGWFAAWSFRSWHCWKRKGNEKRWDGGDPSVVLMQGQSQAVLSGTISGFPATYRL